MFILYTTKKGIYIKSVGDSPLSVVIWLVNPSTPVSDQDTISPYNFNTISSRQAMRIKKNIN